MRLQNPPSLPVGGEQEPYDIRVSAGALYGCCCIGHSLALAATQGIHFFLRYRQITSNNIAADPTAATTTATVTTATVAAADVAQVSPDTRIRITKVIGWIPDTVVRSSYGQVGDWDYTRHSVALYLRLLDLSLVDVHSHAGVQLVQPELQRCIVKRLYAATPVGALVVGCEELVPSKCSKGRGRHRRAEKDRTGQDSHKGS